jgi:nitroreductase
VDTYLAIASKRDERRYAERPLPDDLQRRILDAGRLSGSSQNKQRWEFVIVERQKDLAPLVYAPDNVRDAAFVIAIVGEASPLDVGRCGQNMMLAAWNEGVVSCPNGVRDREAADALLGGEVKMILSFGYPARPRAVGARSAEEWSARANRKPLDELVRRI